MQQLEHRLLNLLRATGSVPFDSQHILEIGCGTGHWLREFIKWGAPPENITGIDLLADRIAMARRLCPGGVRLECGSAAQLPFSESTYDLVLQATVFTSILDHNMRKAVAARMVRVVRPN